MSRINIKPLSVNECWQGKRFKTPKYKAYEKELLYTLPSKVETFEKMEVHLEFGVSALSDIDNPIKPLLDILQKKYNFNDRDIMIIRVQKVVVKKGKEYLTFDIKNG